jgi:3-oxoacyl-[acyl-carrier protein] reductase/pteridine reductase
MNEIPIRFSDVHRIEGREARGDAMIRSTPARRSGTAEEIADAVIYFLTASNFITGQLLAVDGGLSQK